MGRRRTNGSHLDLLLPNLPASFVWTTNRDLELTSVAGAALGLIGVRDAKADVGKPLAKILAGARDGGAAILDAHRRALDGHNGTLVETTRRWSFDVHLQPLRDGDEIVGVGGIAIDATKRGVAESELIASEARFRTLVERLPICTYINPLGLPIRTTYISPYIETLLGFPVERWLHENDFFVTRLHPDGHDRVLAAAHRTHSSGDPFRETYRLVAKDGRVVQLLDETMTVCDDRGRPLFLQGFFVEVGAEDTREEPASLAG